MGLVTYCLDFEGERCIGNCGKEEANNKILDITYIDMFKIKILSFTFHMDTNINISF